MCCFSGPVKHVSSTQIFARPISATLQVVAYQMEIEAARELAMILPLPVKRGTNPSEFTFIDLSGYPQFFVDLAKGFPTVLTPPPSDGSIRSVASAAPLPVVSVGNFEASFVPALKDFTRLDPRFQIDSKIWHSLPGYNRMSFAVFKLKPGHQKVHPMAFSFPRENPAELFFPTLHIHDGKVHKQESFDHTLFCQASEHQTPEIVDWEESRTWAEHFTKPGKSKGLIVPSAHVYRKFMIGNLPNRDTQIKVA